jgi:restriction system protein
MGPSMVFEMLRSRFRPNLDVYRITARGLEVLKAAPPKIDIHFLERFPEFLEFRSRTGEAVNTAPVSDVALADQTSELTPDEQIRAGYLRLRASLAAQLLERTKQASPAFFEELVVQVLVAMGYGGSQQDAARVVGRSGDGGIDGIIKQDRLGLENIYVQAKRWEGTVGRPTIQQFAGALQGQRARKGVLITTSEFTRDAVEYAGGLQNTIVFVSGAQLAELMIDYNVGVGEGETLKLKKLDEDYFDEE